MSVQPDSSRRAEFSSLRGAQTAGIMALWCASRPEGTCRVYACASHGEAHQLVYDSGHALMLLALGHGQRQLQESACHDCLLHLHASTLQVNRYKRQERRRSDSADAGSGPSLQVCSAAGVPVKLMWAITHRCCVEQGLCLHDVDAPAPEVSVSVWHPVQQHPPAH